VRIFEDDSDVIAVKFLPRGEYVVDLPMIQGHITVKFNVVGDGCIVGYWDRLPNVGPVDHLKSLVNCCHFFCPVDRRVYFHGGGQKDLHHEVWYYNVDDEHWGHIHVEGRRKRKEHAGGILVDGDGQRRFIIACGDKKMVQPI